MREEDLKILYEDNHLIAVFKPAGVLTQQDGFGELSLMDEVKEYLKEKYKKPGDVFLGLLHRLDRPVSGIILFAKTSKAASRISEQFRDRKIKKIYHAVVKGFLSQRSGSLLHYVRKDRAKNKIEVSEQKKAGFQSAELCFKVLKRGEKYSLLEIELKTGRFHQIRGQLSAIGHPIVGDKKYGASFSLSDKAIALQASEIIFKLVTKAGTKRIKVPLPDHWKKYI